jgi:hypothetical protein
MRPRTTGEVLNTAIYSSADERRVRFEGDFTNQKRHERSFEVEGFQKDLKYTEELIRNREIQIVYRPAAGVGFPRSVASRGQRLGGKRKAAKSAGKICILRHLPVYR